MLADEEAIRFQLSKRKPLLIVQGLVNGKGPFSFVVDTGASVTVLSPHVAKQAGLSLCRIDAKAISAGGRLDTAFGRLNSLRIGTVEVRNLRVAIMSLTRVNRAAQLRLGGIIGHNLLRRFRVTIDYPSGHLFLQIERPL